MGWWIIGTEHLVASEYDPNDPTRAKAPDPRGETTGGQLADKLNGLMTLGAVQDELGKLTFWPNYHFAAFQHPFRGIVVRIVFSVPDSNDMKRTVTIGNTHNVPTIALRCAADFHEWLLDEMKQKAIHETVEAYRVAGVPLHDPHSFEWSELVIV
jgi:hypothetical protein